MEKNNTTGLDTDQTNNLSLNPVPIIKEETWHTRANNLIAEFEDEIPPISRNDMTEYDYNEAGEAIQIRRTAKFYDDNGNYRKDAPKSNPGNGYQAPVSKYFTPRNKMLDQGQLNEDIALTAQQYREAEEERNRLMKASEEQVRATGTVVLTEEQFRILFNKVQEQEKKDNQNY